MIGLSSIQADWFTRGCLDLNQLNLSRVDLSQLSLSKEHQVPAYQPTNDWIFPQYKPIDLHKVALI